MNDTTDLAERMPMVPDADGHEQRVDDGKDETLLMHSGAELEAESTMDGNSADTGCAENPAPKYILQLVKDYFSLNVIKWTRMIRHYRGASGEMTADVLKKKVMAAKGELPFSVTNVNDYMKKCKFDNVHGCRYDPRVFNADCNRTYALQVCMQGTQKNAIDDNIRHFDKKIDRDGSENVESILSDDKLLFLVINAKGYAVKFKFDNVYSCCPGARVSDTECDHIRAL